VNVEAHKVSRPPAILRSQYVLDPPLIGADLPTPHLDLDAL
jgi:hypothetical protein